LSSETVRGGHWVLDGVRNGQDLAESLGARLERYLHDARLDDWIETIRIAALQARGIASEPTAIVDGVLAARAFSRVAPTDQEAAFRTEVRSKTNPTGTDPLEDARRAAVRRCLRRAASDLDAVADLTMAQSVHSLLQDNSEAASAALAVTGGGDGSVPPIDVTSTARDAQLISHRVVAMWAGTPKGEASSPLGAAEPRLTPWLEHVLPAPDRVVADVEVIGEHGAMTVETMALSDLGMSSVDAALLAGAAPTQQRSRLGRAIAAAANVTTPRGSIVMVDLSAPKSVSDDTISVDEFGLIGAAVLDVLGRSRPLGAADLVLPSVDASANVFDAAELDDRIAPVEAVLGRLHSALSGEMSDRVGALVQCAAIGIPKSIKAIEDGAGDEAVARIRAEVKRRLATVVKATRDPIETAMARLRLLCGEAYPILPTFVPVADADRVAAASSESRLQQATDAGPAWLRQYGRVRPDLGATAELLLLAESATGGAVGGFGLAELPHTSGPWAAVDRPPDDADRLSILALTGSDALGVDSAAVAGLLFDSWTEGIPRLHQQTAVAVHFDAPTARPPQTVLLSVVDEERGFDVDEVADQLLHTVEMAKLRAVGPNDLGVVGHYLPAVFVPDDVVVSGAPA
jgi:hypothetical protein